MSRLTPNWTKHAKDAYGPSGEKGSDGEKWLAAVLTKKNYNVSLHEDDKQLQLKGIDITVEGNGLKEPITIDVKCNIKSDGTFFVETSQTGWLFNSKKNSNFICHVCPATGWIVKYGRKSMKDAISQLSINADLLPLNIYTVADKFNFVKLTKADSSL